MAKIKMTTSGKVLAGYMVAKGYQANGLRGAAQGALYFLLLMVVTFGLTAMFLAGMAFLAVSALT